MKVLSTLQLPTVPCLFHQNQKEKHGSKSSCSPCLRKSTQRGHACRDQDAPHPNARPAQHPRRLSPPRSPLAATHPIPPPSPPVRPTGCRPRPPWRRPRSRGTARTRCSALRWWLWRPGCRGGRGGASGGVRANLRAISQSVSQSVGCVCLVLTETCEGFESRRRATEIDRSINRIRREE